MNPIVDAGLLIVFASLAMLVGEMLVIPFGTHFGFAVISYCLISAFATWVACLVHRCALRRLGLGPPLSGVEREFVRSETASLMVPATTVAVMSFGAALGLAGILGGNFADPLIGFARGTIFASLIGGSIALGNAYVRLERARDPIGFASSSFESEAALNARSSDSELAAWFSPRGCPPEERHGYVLSAAYRLYLFVLTGALFAVPLTSNVLVAAAVVLLEAWLVAFFLLLRVHRRHLWHTSELFQQWFIYGVLVLGAVVIRMLSPGHIGGFFTVFALPFVTMAPYRKVTVAPPVAVAQTPTMMAVDRVLARRASRMSTSAITFDADRVKATRPVIERADSYAESLDFSGQALQNRDFSGESLNFACFKDADCRHCNFDLAHMEGVDFTNANLEGATFRGATLAYAVMSGANVTRADFSHSKMFTSDVTGCLFGRANLHGAFFRGLWFDDSTSWPAGTDTDFIRTKRSLWAAAPSVVRTVSGSPA